MPDRKDAPVKRAVTWVTPEFIPVCEAQEGTSACKF